MIGRQTRCFLIVDNFASRGHLVMSGDSLVATSMGESATGV